jgi:hypothetical protein
MGFSTKIDISRQAAQQPESEAYFSGATSFGVPFSALTVGPDPNNSGVTQTIFTFSSTFTGNTTATTYTWFDNRMNLANSFLSAITPTTSAETQDVTVFTGSSSTTIDGNLVYLSYSGVSFDITVGSIITLSGGTYSGTVLTNSLDILTAGALDFSGRTIWVDVSGITRTDSLLINQNATISGIGSAASAGALYYTSDGTLTTNTSDRRLKTNIIPIKNALDKVNKLKGVFFAWNENPLNNRIGFIAQEVNAVQPELTFVNPNSPEKYMGVHYDSVTALLVEAVKELSSGGTVNNILSTQTIVAEDNFIELNYNGDVESAVGGGIKVLHAINADKSAELQVDSEGNWITNNTFKPQSLTIPLFTPSNSKDIKGNTGNLTRDDNYLYLKTSSGWKRLKLEEF